MTNFCMEDSSSLSHDDIHVATCGLFLELAHIDGEFSAEERQVVFDVMLTEFGLSQEVAEAILEKAQHEVDSSSDLWQMTKLVKEHYPNEAQIRIVENLWKLVLADGRIDDHEDYLMKKLYDLLHVEHEDFIAAKLRALASKKAEQ